MAVAALSAVCLALGLVIGYEWGKHGAKNRDAPMPVMPDYDVDNPINAKWQRGQVVEICGAKWTVM